MTAQPYTAAEEAAIRAWLADVADEGRISGRDELRRALATLDRERAAAPPPTPDPAGLREALRHVGRQYKPSGLYDELMDKAADAAIEQLRAALVASPAPEPLLDVAAPAADHVGSAVPSADDGAEGAEPQASGASSPLGVAPHGLAESFSVPAAHGSHTQQWEGRYTAPEPTGLDAAWAEAEAALPEAMRIDLLAWPTEDDDEWVARATGNGRIVKATGPDPAAALRALAARLAATEEGGGGA